VSAEFTKIITERRAVRSYKPDMVPDSLLREILAEARWAPSATNTQTTWVYALSGEPLKKFKADLLAYAESEVAPNPDLPMGAPLRPPYLTRQQELFKTRMEFIAAEEARMGIPQPEKPVPPPIAGASIFGAPVVLVLAVDKDVTHPYGVYDAGLFSMAIALVAHDRGLGTCITGSNVRYPDLLRKYIPGTENQDFITAIAIGYPDWEAPVNRFPRNRIPVDEFTKFVK
jgi:nitroreductase